MVLSLFLNVFGESEPKAPADNIISSFSILSDLFRRLPFPWHFKSAFLKIAPFSTKQIVDPLSGRLNIFLPQDIA